MDEYESLPESCGPQIHMLAGAGAGIAEHCVMYPVDVVKTRMQSLNPCPQAAYRNVPSALLQIVQKEGYLRPWKGMSVLVCSAGPAHAMYFACYEKMKRVFARGGTGNNNPLAQGAAGCLATIFHDAVMNPADVVKQRLQIYNSPYSSITACARDIYKKEGLKAFYRSYTTSLSMNVPFQSIHFMTYEFMQEQTNHSRQYNPTAHMISGAVAGAVASAATNPLDVCKTLLNTQEVAVVNQLSKGGKKKSQIRGLLEATRTIHRCCGWSGYCHGLSARIAYSMPSTALAWSVYEFFKYALYDGSGTSAVGNNPSSSSGYHGNLQQSINNSGSTSPLIAKCDSSSNISPVTSSSVTDLNCPTLVTSLQPVTQ